MANSKDNQNRGPSHDEPTRATIKKRWDFGYDGGKPKAPAGETHLHGGTQWPI
jgi:hypothetical protein